MDDYKVIVGTKTRENQTCVHVLSLKSNEWRVIGFGKVKYSFLSKFSILCNGALHWIVRDENRKILIIAYDLCKGEECLLKCVLGIMEEYLCIILAGPHSKDDEKVQCKTVMGTVVALP
ncbi:hypothetical protein Hanom_Chr02g00175991 [Helianthus anomalus]